MLKSLTSEQLTEWEAYDKLDPIGKWRDELGFAMLSSLITNIVRQLYPEKGRQPILTAATDFMLKWGEEAAQKPEPKKQSVDDMKQIFHAIASVQGTKKKMK